MNKALSEQIITSATKSVYELQYNTRKAAQFVCSEVPTASFDMAMLAISQVVRPTVNTARK
jgi:hypothetical protein